MSAGCQQLTAVAPTSCMRPPSDRSPRNEATATPVLDKVSRPEKAPLAAAGSPRAAW